MVKNPISFLNFWEVLLHFKALCQGISATGVKRTLKFLVPKIANWEDLLYDKSKYKFPKLAIRVLIFSPLVPINEPRFSDPKKRTNKYLLFQIIQCLKIYVFTHLYNRHLLFYPLKGILLASSLSARTLNTLFKI